MRVALISDLHGNELALEAALDDIARAGVDRLVCLGDVATLGVRPREVLARLRALECECIMGNHDAFLLEPDLIRRYTEAPEVVAAVDWCRAQLGSADLDFLRAFRTHLDVPLDGDLSLFLYHGTPRSHMEDLLATTPAATVDDMLDGRQATVMAGGHTHVQMLRQHRGTLLVNPGSVGMPFVNYVQGAAPTFMPHAEYAIVEGTRAGVVVRLCRVTLERRALRAQVAPVADFPLRAYHLQQYAD